MKKLITTIIASAALFALSGVESIAQDTDTKPKLVAGKDPQKALIGYWAPNKEAVIKMMGEFNKGGQDPAAIKAIEAMVTEMIKSMVMEFKAGEATMHTPGGAETSTYKVTSSNAATGELKVVVTEKGGTPEAATAIVKGDKLTLNKGDGKNKAETLVLDRLTEAEFKKRVAAIKAQQEAAPKIPQLKELRELEKLKDLK